MYTGSRLSSCTVNGQQCCSQNVINIFKTGLRAGLGNELELIGGFDGAQAAINRLRNEIDGNDSVLY